MSLRHPVCNALYVMHYVVVFPADVMHYICSWECKALYNITIQPTCEDFAVSHNCVVVFPVQLPQLALQLGV